MPGSPRCGITAVAMNSCLCIVLAAAVATSSPPDERAASFAALEARMQDHVEQRRYETLVYEAEAAGKRRDLTPAQRRQMVFFAVQGLHGLYQIVRQPAGLCRARGLLRRIEREGRLPAGDRAIAERLRTITEQQLRDTGLKNPCTPAKAPTSPPPTAAVAAAPTTESLLPVSGDEAPTGPGEAGAPSSVPSPPAQVQAASAGLAGPSPGPAAPPAELPTGARARGWLVTGSLFMVAGAGLTAGMGVYLHNASELNAAIGDIKATFQAEGRGPTQAERDLASSLNQRHEYETAYAAIAGGGAVVCFAAGIALLLAAPRRARVAAQPWGGAHSVGVTLGGRF